MTTPGGNTSICRRFKFVGRAEGGGREGSGGGGREKEGGKVMEGTER